ncbi:MAG: DUF4231 domain-containing protein [Pseudomonadota bacterium]|nr:DUF4231 domain-containing protein [Pseudomonadota bacterium]
MCTATNKQCFLLQEIEDKIGQFKKESNKHKRMHRGFRYCAYVFTGALTILSGCNLFFEDPEQTLSIVVLVVSACASVVASIEGLRKSDELWHHERMVYLSLLDLKRKLEYSLHGSSVTEVEVDAVFEEFQALLSQSRDIWSTGIVNKQSGTTIPPVSVKTDVSSNTDAGATPAAEPEPATGSTSRSGSTWFGWVFPSRA